MAITYYDSDFSESSYILNYFATKKIDDDHYIITTDHGAWVVLSKEEYNLLRFENIERDPSLFSLLKEKGIILTEGNIRDIVKAYAERNHFLFKAPTLHIVTPTMRCNSNCVYCHSASIKETKKTDMDIDTAKSIIDFILKVPSKNLAIEFQGGDCLLNFPVVEYMIDYAKEKSKNINKKVNFRMVTNLTLMDDDILKSLSKRKLMGISTSLDGPKDIHDKNRK